MDQADCDYLSLYKYHGIWEHAEKKQKVRE